MLMRAEPVNVEPVQIAAQHDVERQNVCNAIVIEKKKHCYRIRIFDYLITRPKLNAQPY